MEIIPIITGETNGKGHGKLNGNWGYAGTRVSATSQRFRV